MPELPKITTVDILIHNPAKVDDFLVIKLEYFSQIYTPFLRLQNN